jgi:hypothetical protein
VPSHATSGLLAKLMVMLHVASGKVQISWTGVVIQHADHTVCDCAKQIYQLWHYLSQQLTSTHTDWGADLSNLYNDVNNGQSETVPKCRSWFNQSTRILWLCGSSFLVGLATRKTDNLQHYYRTVTHIVCVCVCTHTHAEWVKFWKHYNLSTCLSFHCVTFIRRETKCC